MDIVKLQGRYGTSMTHQAPMHLTAPQVPQTNHAIGRSTRKRRIKHLHRADKIGIGVR